MAVPGNGSFRGVSCESLTPAGWEIISVPVDSASDCGAIWGVLGFDMVRARLPKITKSLKITKGTAHQHLCATANVAFQYSRQDKSENSKMGKSRLDLWL